MAKAVGIDLGTTNSVVAILDGVDPVVVANAEGGRTTPSVVAFATDGEVLVGEVAKRQAITNPSRTFRSAKREMGTSWLSADVDGKRYTAQEISARTLMKLKRDAEAYCGEEVTHAVITVPAYFDDAQRTATKEAGQIAGLEVLRIVNEPTAAALAYGLDQGTNDETILVFDLGGGTLDVSVLEISDGMFSVKATQGDTHLGGDDWDQRIIDWLLQRFNAGHGVDLSLDPMAMQRLKEAAERVKIELSQLSAAHIHLPFITATFEGPLHLDEQLSAAKFQEMTADLIERCRVPFERALADAGLAKGELDHVILVGGSTRMPAVAELVLSLTGREPSRNVNADEVVALGAAVQAGVLTGDVTDVLLLDVTPLSLGVETLGGVMTTLIARNTTIPTVVTEVFSTAADCQVFVDVHVLQGEREMSAGNKTLGRFQLVDLPEALAGVPKIEVTFDIDANGIVHVSAIDQESGSAQSMTISGQSDLGADDIAAMIADAERHAREDVARRATAEVRNAADSSIYDARRLQRFHAGTPDVELVEVVAARAVLVSVIDGMDVDAIVAATAVLRAAVAKATFVLGEPAPLPADGDADADGAADEPYVAVGADSDQAFVEDGLADAHTVDMDEPAPPAPEQVTPAGDDGGGNSNDTPLDDDATSGTTASVRATLFNSDTPADEHVTDESDNRNEPVPVGDDTGAAHHDSELGAAEGDVADDARVDDARVDGPDRSEHHASDVRADVVTVDEPTGAATDPTTMYEPSADELVEPDDTLDADAVADEAAPGDEVSNGPVAEPVFDERSDDERTYDGMFDDDLDGGELTDAGMFDDEPAAEFDGDFPDLEDIAAPDADAEPDADDDWGAF